MNGNCPFFITFLMKKGWEDGEYVPQLIIIKIKPRSNQMYHPCPISIKIRSRIKECLLMSMFFIFFWVKY